MEVTSDGNRPESAHKFLARLLADRKITMYALAKESKLTPDVVSRLVKGTRAFTPDTACRIGKALGIPPENNLLVMQAKFDFAAVSSDEKYESITPMNPDSCSHKKTLFTEKYLSAKQGA